MSLLLDLLTQSGGCRMKMKFLQNFDLNFLFKQNEIQIFTSVIIQSKKSNHKEKILNSLVCIK